MSLNWKEIALIIQEANLQGSKIQNVVQNSFHSITWQLYSREKGRYDFYTEIGTPNSRLHLISNEGKISKTKKLQRFEQFARKNIEGSVIVSCKQLPFDRVVIWELNNHDRLMKIYIRLYSGNGANIIVTDSEDNILDLMFRRPGRDETSHEKLILQKRTEDTGNYEVRPHEGSFNKFIETTCSEIENNELLENLRKSVETLREHETGKIKNSIRSMEKTIESNKDYLQFKYEADLLSANAYLIKHRDSSVTVTDYVNNRSVTISLNKALSSGQNVEEYYNRYQKAKGAYENACEEKEKLISQLESLELKFQKALTPSDDLQVDIRKLKSILDKTSEPKRTETSVGLRCISGGFEILIGRNAKENDELLRHNAKGNDLWLHTRDFPGGYVFIKNKKDRTVPLQVLLDAANLAVLFSKGRNNKKVDLYYTHVKYLRRAKDSKTGLVLPTQEKNLTVDFDEKRAMRLLNEQL